MLLALFSSSDASRRGGCRRNKDCTRSFKKKSGPAKGTKYAARRTRSHEDPPPFLSAQNAGEGGGAAAAAAAASAGPDDLPTLLRGSSSSATMGGGDGGNAAAATAFRRSASAGESQDEEQQQSHHHRQQHYYLGAGVGRGMPPHHHLQQQQQQAYRQHLHHQYHRSPFPQELGMFAGGAHAVGGDPDGGASGDEDLAMRSRQQGGAGGGGGAGAGDSESQQLIRNFPGIMQVREGGGKGGERQSVVLGNASTKALDWGADIIVGCSWPRSPHDVMYVSWNKRSKSASPLKPHFLCAVRRVRCGGVVRFVESPRYGGGTWKKKRKKIRVAVTEK